jgi:Xaa-Pro aminopeptidase
VRQDIRDRIDWEQPFPPEEYADRRARVGAALERAGYDGILVTAPRDFYYLTGHDQIWQHRNGLTGLYFDTASGTSLVFDNASHQAIVSTTPEITDVAYHPRGRIAGQIRFVVDLLAGRDWGKGRVAIQTMGYGAHPDHVRAIGARLAANGATVVEDSDLIEDVRLYKSPREIAVMREAGEVCVAAMAAARDMMKPGVMETEIDAVLCYEMMTRGCGHPGIRTMIGSGARSGDHHGPASHRRLKAGDVVHIDFSASLHRYHTNLSRSFAVGGIDPRWHDLMDRSAGCSDAIVAGVKPGDPYSAVQDAADAFIASSGVDRARYEWYIGGYVLGIAFPPDWVDRHRPRPFEDAPDPPMKPGMVFNFEVQYDVFDGWPGGSGAGWIDSYLMTETGLENLTDTPRNLVVVGG